MSSTRAFDAPSQTLSEAKEEANIIHFGQEHYSDSIKAYCGSTLASKIIEEVALIISDRE